MRRSLVIAAAAVALVLALPAFGGAAPREINVGDDFFAPKNPPARGTSPTAAASAGRTAAGRAIPTTSARTTGCSPPARLTDGPIDFSIRASAGSYHYFCYAPRHSRAPARHDGRVKVRPIRFSGSRSGEIGVRWANSNTNTGSRFDVRYKVGQGRWKTWKNDTAAFRAFFGRNDRPVNYRPNRRNYKLKVRSERKDVSKRSDWSPVLRIG